MKKLLSLLLLFIVLNRTSAALPFSEPFADQTGSGGTAYAVDSFLAGQTNSGNAWQVINSTSGTNQPVIASGNLSYLNLPSSTGNSALISPATVDGAAGGRLNLNATVTSGRTYYSVVLKITNIDAVPFDAQNNWFSGFGDGVGTQGTPLLRIGAKVLTKRVGGGYVFGIGRTTNAVNYVYDESHVYSVNDSVFVVAAYEQLAGSATNEYIWINPAPSTFGASNAPAPTLSVSTVAAPATGVLNTSGVKSLILACQNATAPAAIVDEVRVGTNWISVVPVSDPSITQNPVSLTVPPGSNATFGVIAAGTPTLSYQWVKNGTISLSDGGNISGAHMATLTVNNVSGGDEGAYSVIVSNGVGASIQSASASLSLANPAISSQPQSRTNNYGTTATFSVSASGTAPFGYQWHKEGFGDLSDGGIISGSQSATLTLTGVSNPDAGNYSVTVTNTLGMANSTTAVLTVKDPFIVTQPAPVTNTAGATITFHVAASGSGSLVYQWRKGTNFLADVGNLSGTSTDTLTVSAVSSTDQGNYSVAVIGATIEFSADASLTVLTPVSITIQPAPRTVAQGSKVAFGVVAAGATPFTYQWFLNGTNLPGATASSYSLTNAQTSVAGNYTVVVSNVVDSATSSPAALNVTTNLQLYETNLAVVRVGDVAQTLTVNGNSIYFDQFDISGNYVNTVNIPDDGSSAIVAIGWDNISGPNTGSTTGTSLTRSLDGRFLVVAGYNTNLNYGADLSASVSTNVPRGIALINSHAQYQLPVASTDPVFDHTFWRAAVTDGTNNFWGAGGIAGTYYFGFDAPPVLVQNTFDNNRSMGLFNGDIYCATAASFVGQPAKGGLLKMNGMPTNPVTPTVVFDSTVGASSGAYDMAVSQNGNLIYLCDQRNRLSGGGIQRYEFTNSSWSLTYTLTNGVGNLGPRYIAGDFSGADPVLYVTSNDQTFDNNRIIKFVDTGVDSAGTTIAFAGPNQTFRGIHFGPVASPAIVTSPVLSIVRNGSNVILSWSGAFTLQSSTNVAGTYNDVGGATSPYTNSVSPNTQLFFRLHQ